MSEPKVRVSNKMKVNKLEKMTNDECDYYEKLVKLPPYELVKYVKSKDDDYKREFEKGKKEGYSYGYNDGVDAGLPKDDEVSK